MNQYKTEHERGLGGIGRTYTADAITCPECGWWMFKKTRSEVYSGDWNRTETLCEGIVYQFHVQSLRNPLSALRRSGR